MPFTVRKFNAQVRDPNTGNMIPAGLLSSDALGVIDDAKDDAVIAVQTQQTTSVNAVTAAGTAASANFPQTAAACDTLAGDFAATYVPNQAYSVGDYCTYQYQLYRCKVDIPENTDATFVTSHWQAVQLANTLNDEVGNLKTQFDGEFTTDVSPNLLNPDAFISGKRINSSGVFYSTSGAHASNIMNVEGFTSLAIYAPITAGTTSDYYSFASSDTFTSDTIVGHGTFVFKHEVTTLAVPEGAKYFAFGFSNNNYYDYVKGLSNPVGNVQSGTIITDWRPYGESSTYLTDIAQEPGIDSHAPISQKGATDYFVQKTDIVESTGNNSDKIISQKKSTEMYDASIKNGAVVLNANANVDDPSSDYYAYRDFDNFPVNTTIRVVNNARVRPRLTLAGGTHVYQDDYFIGDASARAAYVGQTVTVTCKGESVTGTVDAQNTWFNAALDHAPVSYATLGHAGEPVESGIYASVTTFYSNAAVTGEPRYKVQFCVTYSSAAKPYLCYRISNGTTWGDWSSISERGVLHSTNRVVDLYTYDTMTFDDFDKAPANTMYQVDLNCGSVVKHNPAPGVSGVLMTYAFSVSTRHGLVQQYYALKSGKINMYYRYGYQNTGTEFKFTPWEKPSTTTIYTAAANVPLVSGNVPGTALASPSGGETGTEVTLTATAAEGYIFDHWEVTSGGVTISDNKFILGTANVEVDAVFVAQ